MNIFRNYYKNKTLETFMRVVESHLNRWYIWGGDDPQGFDCSGLVVEGLLSIGFIKGDATAQSLFDSYREHEIQKPIRGALVFYFDRSGLSYHVGICLDETFCLTADGGGSHVKTVQDAIDNNAFIKIRRIDNRSAQTRFVYLFNKTTKES